MRKTCRIQKYDPKCKQPPLTMITLVEKCEFEESERDYLGEERYRRLCGLCTAYGYVLRFYSMSSEKDVDYDITVWS
jgi:hypothetical protein